MLVTTGGQSTRIPGFCGQVRGPCSQGLMWGKEEREGGGLAGWQRPRLEEGNRDEGR